MGGEGSPQFLQLVLMPGQQIITSEHCIQFTSENVKIQEKYNFRERIKHYLSNDYPKFGCIVSNLSNNIQYIGLSLNMGRVLVHDCNSHSMETSESSFFQLGLIGGLLNYEFLHGIGRIPGGIFTIDNLILNKDNNSLNIQK